MKLSDSGPPITTEMLETIESLFDFKFPEDYRKFMLVHNGGRPEAGVFFGENVSFRIVHFFSLDEQATINLVSEIDYFRTEIRSDAFPISLDEGGNRICLGTLSSNFGNVLFWDHEVENDTPLIYVTNNFTSLIKGLVPRVNYDSDLIENLGKSGNVEDIKQYLERGSSLFTRNENDLNILDAAAMYGNLEVVKFCIDKGCSYSKTLHYAVKYLRRAVIEYLVGLGVDVNEINQYGFPPLEHLPLWGNELEESIKQYLVAHGAKRTMH